MDDGGLEVLIPLGAALNRVDPLQGTLMVAPLRTLRTVVPTGFGFGQFADEPRLIVQLHVTPPTAAFDTVNCALPSVVTLLKLPAPPGFAVQYRLGALAKPATDTCGSGLTKPLRLKTVSTTKNGVPLPLPPPHPARLLTARTASSIEDKQILDFIAILLLTRDTHAIEGLFALAKNV